MEKKIFTCSDCDEFSNPGDCRKYHTFFSRIIEFCFRTDRTLCLEKIKQTGTESFASQMEEKGWLSIPKKKG